MKENIIETMCFDFSISIIDFSESLEKSNKWVVAKQILRSGTSIGANVSEAQFAESKKDFIHKLKIAAKEANETSYWLKICDKAESYPNVGRLNEDVLGIKKVLSKIISTSINS
jgi:four helix bundle protein